MEGRQLTPAQVLDGQVRSGKMLEKIRAVLPDHINEDAFIVNAVKYCTTNKNIMSANRDSIIFAIIDAAKAGLMLDGKEAFINTYGGSAVMQAMYTGNAKRAGLVKFGAVLVCEGDHYKASMGIEGATFEYSMARKGRGELELVVAWGVDHDGFKRILELPASRVYDIKKRETSKRKNGPWDKDSDEMMKKHAINVMCKHILNPEIWGDSSETVDQNTGEIKEIDITKPSSNLTAAQIAVRSLNKPEEETAQCQE